MVDLLFLWIMLARLLGGLRLRPLLATLAKVGGASLAMGLAVAWLHPLLLSRMGSGLLAQMAALGAAITLGIGLYALTMSFLNVPEFRELTEKFLARLKR
jgi:hypothetical protein